MNNDLADYLSNYLTASSDPILKAFVDDINAQLADSVIAIIFYGSCLRSQKYDDAMLDFYVIVDEYKNCYSSRLEAIVNSILPPNVYFLPTNVGDKKYISKYAVVSYQQLVSKVSEKSFHPYFWARFCQPISTLYLKNDQARKDIVNIQALAVETFLLATRANSYQSASYDNQSIWVKGFELTYAAELRAESKGRAKQIFENNKEFYSGITQALQSDTSKSLFIESSKSHRLFVLSWRMRNILGRCLSISRLFKASFTFKNGVDYIAWKIERHTGEKIAVSPRLRRFPWIFAWPILFKLLSKRTIK